MSKYGTIKETLKANNSCLEHFYTIRYNTFLDILLCSTTCRKLVFYAGFPLKHPDKRKKKRVYLCFIETLMSL